MKRYAAALPLLAALLFLAGGASRPVRADVPYGSFVTQGQKGPITLKLAPGADGAVNGSLSGGSFNAKLEGDTENGVTTGVIVDAQDQVIGDFRVARTAAGVLLELGEESDEGQFTVKNRLVFTTGGAAPAGPNGGAPKGSSAGGSRPSSNAGGTPSNGGPWRAPVVSKPSGGAARTAARPAAKPKAVAGHKRTGGTAVASGGPAAGARGWKTYKHAVGISMRYPGDWKLHRAGEALQLIPPDALMVNGQAREIYVGFADGNSGVTSAQDPRVVQLLDQKMQGFAPFLQRTSEPQSVSAGTLPGIKVTWEGTNPMGMQVLAHMYVVLLKGYGVGVLAMGDSKRIAARESTVRAMFSSLAASSESRDARLAGSWNFWSYKGNSQFSRETKRRMVLDPGGRCSWSSNSEAVGSFKTGNLYNNSGDGSMGKWSAANGVLYILWDDGDSSTWSYRLERTNGGGRRMYLTGSNGKADEWNAQ